MAPLWMWEVVILIGIASFVAGTSLAIAEWIDRSWP